MINAVLSASGSFPSLGILYFQCQAASPVHKYITNLIRPAMPSHLPALPALSALCLQLAFCSRASCPEPREARLRAASLCCKPSSNETKDEHKREATEHAEPKGPRQAQTPRKARSHLPCLPCPPCLPPGRHFTSTRRTNWLACSVKDASTLEATKHPQSQRARQAQAPREARCVL